MQTKLSTAKKSSKKTAQDLANMQREISISEFFTKNRHLLGFDSPRRALMTAVKEAVDNSLDACEEIGVLPEIKLEIKKVEDKRYILVVEDNGPGIVKEQIPKIFGKLLYGSKFHKLAVSRGQQGIGISATALYAQLTTGKGIKIMSKTGPRKKAHFYELHLNLKTNDSEIVKEEEKEWDKEHGTKLQVVMEADYVKGKRSVDEYIKESAMANPHATFYYKSPVDDWVVFKRATTTMPKEPKEIKPHPYGVELGILMRMLKETKAKTLQQFLTSEFSRVSPKIAKEICEKAKLYERARPSRIARQEVDNLYKAIQQVKIMAPPTNCLTPIGEDILIKGIKKEVDAEFYAAVTRPPAVYRGNPFQIECCIAYGGSIPADNLVNVIRFANRVPLLYKQSDCAITKSIIATAWRNYGLSQSKGALPTGPAVIAVHMNSVWIPFTSESKEALASYPEIVKEIKLALQECGRKLASYVRKIKKIEHEKKRQKIFELYIDEVTESLHKLTGEDKAELVKHLHKISEIRTIGESKDEQ
ncbi:DNA topoisomerase VI subunit B [Candidatus Woesearchaeota archaeon]|nr:MAG: DNA topoisomerase VI subunit B [Candidatus Woesearchaeota archaeon]